MSTSKFVVGSIVAATGSIAAYKYISKTNVVLNQTGATGSGSRPRIQLETKIKDRSVEIYLSNTGDDVAVLKSVAINENNITRYRVLSDVSRDLTELCARGDYEQSLKDCMLKAGESVELFSCVPPSKIKSKTQLTQWRGKVKEALRLMDSSAAYRSEEHNSDNIIVEYEDSGRNMLVFEGKLPGVLHEESSNQ